MSTFDWCLNIHIGRLRDGVSPRAFPTDWHSLPIGRLVILWRFERKEKRR